MPIFIRIVPTPTIFYGRAAELIPEGLAEVTAGTKPAAICDLGNRLFGFRQHLTSLLQAVASDIFYRGHVQSILEQTEAGSFTDMSRLRQLLDGNRLPRVFMKVNHQHLDLIIRILTCVPLFHGRTGQFKNLQPDFGQGFPKLEFVAPFLFGEFKGLLDFLLNRCLGGIVRVQRDNLHSGSGGQR